ncbi:MAG: GNAT family N-acetyltransferase [Actinomycetota bacterium]
MASSSIRAAEPSDVYNLALLEVEADQLFLTVGMPAIAGHTLDEEAMRENLEQGSLWVAERQAEITGYILATLLDGNAHIDQVSVAPAHARQGIGRQLISHVENWGKRSNLPATTLTTFRDVPWNGPYYQTLGYRELLCAETGPELMAVMEYQASLPAIDASRRCAMIKRNTYRLSPRDRAGPPPISR